MPLLLMQKQVIWFHLQRQKLASPVSVLVPQMPSVPTPAPGSVDTAGCPVCRSVRIYSNKGPLVCSTCRIPENLWICLLCGHVGCGRYTKEHAQQHYHQSRHSFSLELATGTGFHFRSTVIYRLSPLTRVAQGLWTVLSNNLWASSKDMLCCSFN
jgi:hypothetical protein